MDEINYSPSKKKPSHIRTNENESAQCVAKPAKPVKRKTKRKAEITNPVFKETPSFIEEVGITGKITFYKMKL